MLNATRKVQKRGAQKVLIVGSDCLELSVRHLERARRLLSHKDLVLGPARDGGYYLLGWKKPLPGCFRKIVWSRSDVFQKTRTNAKRGGFAMGLLSVLADVDEKKDLKRLGKRLDRRNPETKRLRYLLEDSAK